jgi:hypothetical protein
MRRTAILAARGAALLGIVALTGALAVTPAPARGRSAYSMEILVDGRPLAEHRARGTTYIEALEGREYSVRLTNHTGERVGVALSVDGLNSIDAKRTSARQASKWILGPYRSITLDGWQTSSASARRFFFTTEDLSYGAWLGEADNLGIVSAAFFRERRPRPLPFTRAEPRGGRGDSSGAPGPSKRLRESSESARAPSDADAKAGADTPALSDDLAATGIGREVDHRVRQVRFDAERHPAAVLELRYEYREVLVRLGVLASLEDPYARRERARGFAPDPFRERD